MLRILNVIAVAVLIGSAVYAYSVKYETILYAEQIIKTRHLIAGEQDGIEKLQAEWAILTRPDRLASLADHGLNALKNDPHLARGWAASPGPAASCAACARRGSTRAASGCA